MNTEIFDDFKDGGHYEYKNKIIKCSVELDYKTSMALTYRREFAQYIKNRFLDKAMDFYEMEIPDFDVDSYAADLEDFLRNTWPIINKGIYYCITKRKLIIERGYLLKRSR